MNPHLSQLCVATVSPQAILSTLLKMLFVNVTILISDSVQVESATKCSISSCSHLWGLAEWAILPTSESSWNATGRPSNAWPITWLTGQVHLLTHGYWHLFMSTFYSIILHQILSTLTLLWRFLLESSQTYVHYFSLFVGPLCNMLWMIEPSAQRLHNLEVVL